jgi:hypothetical protein
MRQTPGRILLVVCLLIVPRPAVAATIGLTNAIGGALSGGSFVVGTSGTTAAQNNWPAAEHPGLAIDGIVPAIGGNKYLNFFEANSGIIVTPTGPNALLPADALSLWTANDAVERDPSSFHILGSLVALSDATPGTSYSLAAMTSIANLPITLPSARNSGPTTVSFSNLTPYASYVILFPSVKNAASANSVQLSELELSSSATVPEPTSLALFAGAASAWLIRRRRAR